MPIIEVIIDEIVAKVRTVDSSTLLDPRLVRRLVQAVLAGTDERRNRESGAAAKIRASANSRPATCRRGPRLTPYGPMSPSQHVGQVEREERRDDEAGHEDRDQCEFNHRRYQPPEHTARRPPEIPSHAAGARVRAPQSSWRTKFIVRKPG